MHVAIVPYCWFEPLQFAVIAVQYVAQSGAAPFPSVLLLLEPHAVAKTRQTSRFRMARYYLIARWRRPRPIPMR
jgi:hypothetical protein